MLDNFIKASGSEGGGYFLGERYSFAETVTTPFVRRALVTLPHFKGVDPLEIAKSKGLDRLVAWIQVSHAFCSGRTLHNTAVFGVLRICGLCPQVSRRFVLQLSW